jgi:FMN-dependent NADH-azoreductase
MSRLLYLQASPRVERSHSRAVADAFVESYSEMHPEDEVITEDLFKADLPPFDGLAVQAKYSILHGQEHSPEEAEAWKVVEAVIDKFKSADKYALAVPMWNFGIPYRLKQYFDLLIQPGYTFAFDPEAGYSGLVKGKPILVVYARGGEFPEGSEEAAYDLQKKSVEQVLGLMGFTDVRSITIEPTLMGGPDTAKSKKEAAIKEARRIAIDF